MRTQRWRYAVLAVVALLARILAVREEQVARLEERRERLKKTSLGTC